MSADNVPSIYELNEQYKSFPQFADWSKTQVETARWDRYTKSLAERKQSSPELLKNALQIVERATAIDTGALEGLYQTDRGFTITVATQGAMWLTKLEESKGINARRLVESQLKAYEYVMDLASQAAPIVEMAIRQIHEIVCASQDTFQTHNPITGVQNTPLEKGVYKRLPNHVIKADGSTHSYAPVEMVPGEMHRLCTELRSEGFLQAHPVLQASYIHYAFVAIHPFADGNGRVARALASIYTYRAQSIPLLILSEGRLNYLNALEKADTGEYSAFVDFTLESALDTIRIIEDSVVAAASPDFSDMFRNLEQLSLTRSGFTHTAINTAADELLKSFARELKAVVGSTPNSPNLKITSGEPSSSVSSAPKKGYRLPSEYGHTNSTSLRVHTERLLKNTALSQKFYCEVPVDSDSNDDILIMNNGNNGNSEIFAARVSELLPTQSPALQIRLKIAAEGVVRALTDRVIQSAEDLNKRV